MVSTQGQVVTELTSVDGREYWSAWRSETPDVIGCGPTEKKAINDLLNGGTIVTENPIDIIRHADELSVSMIALAHSIDALEGEPE